MIVSIGAAGAADYDLVIKNGRVMDPETLYDGVANVGITDGRIVEISREPLSGAEEIDATGHVVAPGFIETDMTRGLPDEQRSALAGQIPLGRLGTPQDVSAAVAFLASGRAAWITGETLNVNGGMHMP